ncbi:L-threonylcarbamoyladenylate synthase [Spirochaeta isovalerica]|uniref:Threonylcarbamoyl-AMP synthase n=1 Tax=Spirochaeta isovalerica TaxID=150 RepID=A0A841RC39_9SPIO|nr:L-threonylcarbamoyladenylate synthase [Spirochaeta isovalerica]MBB6480941.1 L-threonylcarbamoyladenylate synthase [Spirochaeta isovalerica]
MMIYESTRENIEKAARVILDGRLVSFPTETVYGLGGNSLDPKAVARIFEAKARPSFDPLITHIAELEMLDRIADVKSSRTFDIIERFWPGSLTLIVPKRDIIPDIVTSGLDTMAVRMPDHPTALELIRLSSGAVAAPSANPFGYLSPTTAAHVDELLGDKIEMVLEGGTCRIGVESTVLDVTGERPIVLRPGGIALETIRELIPDVGIFNRETTSPTAPGQLKMHYSPTRPLHIVDSVNLVSERERCGALLFKDGPDVSGFSAVEILSPEGDPVEAAARLFVALHNLDRAGIDRIYAEKIPEEGLGRAVMDRIYKASEK